MAIRYKVINRFTRCSALIQDGKYKLKYVKDTTVEAITGTLGIMVFRRRYQAEQFIGNLGLIYKYNLKIIRVEIFGRGRTPKCVSRYMLHSRDLNLFYTKYYDSLHASFYIHVSAPVDGTLCYNKVKVID